jgi:hypothetical protein
MSNEALEVLTAAVVLVQVAVALWALVRRRGLAPVLIVNLLGAIGVLQFVLRYLPEEVASIRAGGATELFDYKNVILAVFEAVTFMASIIALRGFPVAKIIAWVGFVGNFVLSLLAVLFALTFEFKCCGYL